MILDKINKLILQYLKTDGRAPIATIAKSVGLTAPAVAQRVRQMEDDGIIKYFKPVIDEYKLGFHTKAIITLKLTMGQIASFKKILSEFREIKSCYRVTGEDCLMLLVHLKDNEHLVKFLDRITKYGSTKTNIILEEIEI